MNHSLGNDLFLELLNSEFINQRNQFKKGMFMNDEGKRLLIRKIFPDRSSSSVDVYIQYAHVVMVNGELKTDPGVVLGFDFKNKEIYPMEYRSDLLDHTISVYQDGELNQDNADWLLAYCTAWFDELKNGDYDCIDQAQLKAG